MPVIWKVKNTTSFTKPSSRIFFTFLCLINMRCHNFVQIFKKQCNGFISGSFLSTKPYNPQLHVSKILQLYNLLFFLICQVFFCKFHTKFFLVSLVSCHIDIYVKKWILNVTVFLDCFCSLVTILQNNFRTILFPSMLFHWTNKRI